VYELCERVHVYNKIAINDPKVTIKTRRRQNECGTIFVEHSKMFIKVILILTICEQQKCLVYVAPQQFMSYNKIQFVVRGTQLNGIALQRIFSQPPVIVVYLFFGSNVRCSNTVHTDKWYNVIL
jgi:hypothetical protein